MAAALLHSGLLTTVAEAASSPRSASTHAMDRLVAKAEAALPFDSIPSAEEACAASSTFRCLEGVWRLAVSVGGDDDNDGEARGSELPVGHALHVGFCEASR